MPPVRELAVSRHGVLHLGAMHELRAHLRSGGLCIVPSDTCYALAGLPFTPGVTKTIERILGRSGEPISVSFGSLVLAERYVEFHTVDYRLTDDFLPGPLTLVAPLRGDLKNRSIIAKALRTKGTMGVRIPDSAVERQVSAEMEQPLTTTAIRYANKSGVRNFEDAADIVTEAADAVGEERVILAIHHPNIRRGDLSTVVERSPRSSETPIVVHRPGAISERHLVSATHRYHFRDVEDWT